MRARTPHAARLAIAHEGGKQSGLRDAHAIVSREQAAAEESGFAHTAFALGRVRALLTESIVTSDGRIERLKEDI